MASGFARQLGYCSIDVALMVDNNPVPSPIPSWCSNDTFVQSLKDAQTRLWASINGAREREYKPPLMYQILPYCIFLEIYSEVWSYSFDKSTDKFSVADLASLSPGGTESDAIQLWSYGFLGLLDPTGNGTGAGSA